MYVDLRDVVPFEGDFLPAGIVGIFRLRKTRTRFGRTQVSNAESVLHVSMPARHSIPCDEKSLLLKLR